MRGKGFQAGFDPRRNLRGRKLKPGVLQIPDILRMLGQEEIPTSIKGKLPEHIRTSKDMLTALMRVTFLRAIQGESWAVQFVAERTEGKVKDVVEMQGGETLRIVEEIIEVQPSGVK